MSGPERVLLEVGPGRTLSGLAKRVRGAGKWAVVLDLNSMRHASEVEPDVAYLLGQLGRLWQAGRGGRLARLPRGCRAAPGAAADVSVRAPALLGGARHGRGGGAEGSRQQAARRRRLVLPAVLEASGRASAGRGEARAVAAVQGRIGTRGAAGWPSGAGRPAGREGRCGGRLRGARRPRLYGESGGAAGLHEVAGRARGQGPGSSVDRAPLGARRGVAARSGAGASSASSTWPGRWARARRTCGGRSRSSRAACRT